MTSPEITDALLPCPFCGGNGSLDGKSKPGFYRAVCWNCGGSSGYVSAAHNGSPAKAWNARAALAAGAPMSRVKPLEWRTRYFDAEVTIEQASAGTLYQIRDYKGRFWLDIGPDDVGYATLEAAKAAAQADYEARILSALEPAPVQQAAPSGEGE